MDYNKITEQFMEPLLQGRYITLAHIEPILQRAVFANGVAIAGLSVENRPIYTYTIGRGATKLLMWSQMHGNESTTTKALFDLFCFLQSDNVQALAFNDAFTLCFIPMLNPDGAAAYTRENANNIDLNRDAQLLSQPESKILRSVYYDFKPDYCFNLHDQRSIYGVGNSGKSAVVSFLAPSFNQNRDVNTTRLRAMNVISAVCKTLSSIIPENYALFDDSFNLNCVGDTFQFFGTPTILFEAGHFAADYNRDYTRKLIFISYLSALQFLLENDIVSNDIEYYLSISQNKVNFYDLFYINVSVIEQGIKKMINFAVQYDEIIVDNAIQFVGKIIAINNLSGLYAHKVVDCKGNLYSDLHSNCPEDGKIADFSINNVKHFAAGLMVN